MPRGIPVNQEQLLMLCQRLIDDGILDRPTASGEAHPGWWSDYHLEYGNIDLFDSTVLSLGFPTDLSNLELEPAMRKGLVIDEVTMRDLKLLDLVNTIDQTRTQAGHRMLEYLVHFPLGDLSQIGDRQSALSELAGNPQLLVSFTKYFEIMAANERGFVEYVFPQEGDAPPRQEIFQAARNYLAVFPQIMGLLENTKSEKLGQIRDNLEFLLNRTKVRKMYDSIVAGEDTDVMSLHPDVWKESVSPQVIQTLQEISPILAALPQAKITADLSQGSFRLSPRLDGDPVNIHYPINLALDLKEVRKHYFDQNAIFNLYYTSALVESFCSLASLELAINPVAVDFPSLRDADRYECNLVRPNDPYLLMKQGKFVPNDYHIDGETRGFVITGPNTGGKTVYGFTLPKLQVLAQVGASLPIISGDMTTADYVFTLRPASKEQIGEGRYLHSLVRGREILERATPRSLVAIDDFEGTDPEDCYKESLVIVRKLGKIGAAFTVTTQDRRVALDIEANENGEYNGIVPVQLKCEVGPKNVQFFYQVIPGVGKSIGEACAVAAKMDEASLDRLLEQRGFNYEQNQSPSR